MGRIEPGPPTKPLQYRICFHIYLPFHMLIRLLLSTQIYAATPLAQPYKFPLGDGTEWMTAWKQGGPQAVHFFYNIFLLALLLIAMPLYAHKKSTAAGVLTPWDMFKMATLLGTALDDDRFRVSARVAVGTHHLTSGDYFVEETRSLEVRNHEVQLPADLRTEATYSPSSCADLLPGGPVARSSGFFGFGSKA